MTPAERPEPANALPDATRTMWRCEAALSALVVVAVAYALAVSVAALMPWLPLATLAGAIVYVVVVPRERHRRWRWTLREEELDLVQGIWRVRRTIVPITRIQHVAVERTGWTGLFDLVLLRAHTAAGGTTIPGLRPLQADDVRDRILARLRAPDDL